VEILIGKGAPISQKGIAEDAIFASIDGGNADTAHFLLQWQEKQENRPRHQYTKVYYPRGTPSIGLSSNGSPPPARLPRG
jgi:hypothetical protein